MAKENKFAFALLLGASILVMLLYSCSFPLPIIHGKRTSEIEDDDDDDEENI